MGIGNAAKAPKAHSDSAEAVPIGHPREWQRLRHEAATVGFSKLHPLSGIFSHFFLRTRLRRIIMMCGELR